MCDETVTSLESALSVAAEIDIAATYPVTTETPEWPAPNGTNLFIVHSGDQLEKVAPYYEGALACRTEIFKQGHEGQYMVTAVKFTVEENPMKPVQVIGVHDLSAINFNRGAESILETANYRTLHSFIDRGQIAIALGVFGCYYRSDKETWDGGLLSADGCNWDDIGDIFLGSIVGQCLCGMPFDVIQFIHDGIAHLAMPKQEWGGKTGIVFVETEQWKARQAAEAKHSDGSLYFLWHSLENMGLLEHGGSAPGWLTGKGEHFFTLVDAAVKENTDDDEPADEEPEVIKPYEIPKQHAGLMIVDKVERVDELREQFGFDGDHYITVLPNTVWDRATMRNENTSNIYVIHLDSEDLALFQQHASVNVRIYDIFEKYYGQKNIDIEFDIIAVGTGEFIYKHKHRSAESPTQVFVSKPYPNQKEY